MNLKKELIATVKKVKKASEVVSQSSEDMRNEVLLLMAKKLDEQRKDIIEANNKDLKEAERRGLPEKLIQRLKFQDKKIEARIKALKDIASLPAPIGKMENMKNLPSGLYSAKMRIPIGVILMIYEARPHVTINAGSICLKAGNGVILKGSSETLNSNVLLGRLWQEALREVSLPEDAISVIPYKGHQVVNELLKFNNYIDLVIPRGGENLIKLVVENSKIPVIKHYKGICHVYVDESADIDKAIKICLDSKLLMPEVCNAVETILVAERIAKKLLPKLIKAFKDENVIVKGCKKTRQIVNPVRPSVSYGVNNVKLAKEVDWHTEYLDLIISIKTVKDVDEAIKHINFYSSHHTDSIISESYTNIWKFLKQVDSGVVLSNASTMFNDGSSLGMGAEIGISTDKIHARGPMGLQELTTYKFVVFGQGHIMGG